MNDGVIWYYLFICPIIIVSTILFGICLINDFIYGAWVIVFVISSIGVLAWLGLLIWVLVRGELND